MIPLEVEGPWSCIRDGQVKCVYCLPSRQKQAAELTEEREDAEDRGREMWPTNSFMSNSSPRRLDPSSRLVVLVCRKVGARSARERVLNGITP